MISSILFEHRWSSPAVVRLAEELRRALPNLLCNQSLTAAWAYLYDNRPSSDDGGDGTDSGSDVGHAKAEQKNDGRAKGIPEHADTAAVNVNLWLTPNSCATASTTPPPSGNGELHNHGDDGDGGLVVFDRKPPRAWSAEALNRRPDLVRAFLYGGEGEGGEDSKEEGGEGSDSSAVRQVRTGYRFNRMVVFDSLLFHRTDRHRFTQPGVTCRRINLTLLFGGPAIA